jgi:hypothetical protein
LGINVIGFVPVGFAFLAYFSFVKPVQRPALLVLLFGFLLSLTVEVSQWFLPNRDSGMADLVTNTTGTALGVMLHRWSPLRSGWTAILQRRSTNPVVETSLRRSPADEDEKAMLSR